MDGKTIRRYLLAGLLVWLPIWVTLLVIGFVVSVLDTSLSLIPNAYQPQQLLGFKIPGLGVLFSLIILFITGLLFSNIIGKKLLKIGDAIVARIPLVNTIYHAVKQVANTIFTTGSQSFRRVLLVEYPRKGLWSVAFQTATDSHIVADKVGEEMVAIFIPTTPNPTSGFLMMIPKTDTIELDMSIDDALKLVISLGVVQPKLNK